MERFSQLLKNKKNFIFIGETGSGKSEISLNVAAMLNKDENRQVHVFDLDQTKAMFRSRDAEKEMSDIGVLVHYMPQLLDTPVMVNGIIPKLIGKNNACVLDVGGNENAARMIGCLSDYLNGDNTAAIYVLNPYRPWSGTKDDIYATMATVLNACHIENVYFIGNPTFGGNTSKEDVEEGLNNLYEKIGIDELSCIFVKEELFSQIESPISTEIYPLHQYLVYPWATETHNI